MIGKIKALLLGGGADEAAAKGRHRPEDLQLATAALLVEAACMDGHFDQQERATIAALLAGQFGLAAGEVEELIGEGQKAAQDSSQIYAFTRVVKDLFSDQERVRMIEMLWEVVYADGRLHDYESNLMRRVAGLLYVPDRESGEARKRVRKKLGLADAPPSL